MSVTLRRRALGGGLWAALCYALLASILPPATAPAAATSPPAEEPDDAEPVTRLEDSLTVTATRLRDRPEELLRTPAHVTVLRREAIERAGAATLQELLEAESGVTLFDQVGNGVQQTFDLRGFTGGTGTKVFLDGAPLNDPRNNAVALELVPIEALERVEITRGSTAALAGGGSEAGVINLWSRRGRPPGGRLSLAMGDFSTVRSGAELWGRWGRSDLFASASEVDTGGFRENAGGDLRRLALVAGRDLGPGRSLRLSMLAGDGSFGSPGALTEAELAAGVGSPGFNRADYADEASRQAALNYQGALPGSVTLSANGFYRQRDSRILTTGRSAPVFGGFFLDSEATSWGVTAQVQRQWQSGTSSRTLTAGGEWSGGKTGALGYLTSPLRPDRVDPADLASDNTARRDAAAAFLQGAWRPAARWSLTAGLRLDDDRVEYDEATPLPGNDDQRSFSELSLRAGASYAASDRLSLYLSYGEAFLPPTVEELFSFPLFGSNPELEPEDSRSWEVGLRGRWRSGWSVDAALFQIETEDEIVFDAASPLGLFGANVNAGAARRSGFEAAIRGRPWERLHAWATVTLMEAEFASGAQEGRDLPLVPQERFAAGFDLALPARFDLRAQALSVGEQVLDNDDANAAARLDGYTVVHARLGWTPAARRTDGDHRVRLFAEARNLFDERYATRGIYAFDFASFRQQRFLTPAPGRRVMGGIEWRF